MVKKMTPAAKEDKARVKVWENSKADKAEDKVGAKAERKKPMGKGKKPMGKGKKC